MDKKYHALYKDRIFMGGATDVEEMVKNEGVQVVVDLREEATEFASTDPNVRWVKIPLGDNATETEETLFEKAIDEVVHAYQNGQKVAFHCGGGKGRTGTVAIGTLLALGEAKTINEAEEMAKHIRNIINIHPIQRESLEKIFEA